MKTENTFTIHLSNGNATLSTEENIHLKKKPSIRLKKPAKTTQLLTCEENSLKVFLQDRECIICHTIRITFSPNHPMPQKLTCCDRPICFLCVQDTDTIKKHMIHYHNKEATIRLQEEDSDTIIKLGNLRVHCTEENCRKTKNPKLYKLFEIEKHFQKKHPTSKIPTKPNKNNDRELQQLTYTPSSPKMKRSFSFQSFFNPTKSEEIQPKFSPLSPIKKTGTLTLSIAALERSTSLVQLHPARHSTSTRSFASIRRVGSERLLQRFAQVLEAETVTLPAQEEGAVGGIHPEKANEQYPRSTLYSPEVMAELESKIRLPSINLSIRKALSDPENFLHQCVSGLIKQYSHLDPMLFWEAAKMAILEKAEYLQTAELDAFRIDVRVRVASMSHTVDPSDLLPPPSV